MMTFSFFCFIFHGQRLYFVYVDIRVYDLGAAMEPLMQRVA
jgi:hypothetical protein